MMVQRVIVFICLLESVILYELRYNVPLDETTNSSLKWDYDQYDSEVLQFEWSVTREYDSGAVLAFTNYEYMNNADLLVLDESDRVYDAYTNDDSMITLDNDKNIDCHVKSRKTIQKMKQSVVSCKRPVDTCDEHDYVIDSGTVHIMSGKLNQRQLLEIKENRSSLHFDLRNIKLHLQRVQLLKSQEKFPTISNDALHYDFLNSNVTIPNVDTTYWCKRFELPSDIVKEPHHIIRFDGVVSPQSEGVVHHMELFHCNIPPEKEVPEYNRPCTAEQKPMGLTECRRVIGAWALGAANFSYPKEAGGTIGGKHQSKYVVLEVHFNNPDLKAGIIDHSGIRIYYTRELRKNDAAIMEVGLEYNPKNSIPPHLAAFRLSGYCLGPCTNVGLPEEGITVFASQLHTHLTGVQVFTRIIRKDGTIEILNIDRHYSPHFQEIRILQKPIKIYKGDTILHTCIFNTRERKKMTFGGFSIHDEMCVNYMHYYPKADLEVCKTSVNDDSLNEFFSAMYKVDYAQTDENKTVEQNYESITWTPLTSAILQTFYEQAPIHFSCNGSNGNYLSGENWNKYSAQEPLQRDVSLPSNCR
ncbi:unnamed protein product [Didymodactylos carnosus]|uniref:Tyramine beta hydroxylase n=1 Tax=Didymodactylos carnosus TaxID=1234261 RepID=A0A814RBA9_9BILA|nr:unnamed protein product [Didymodactylos carnosus]CAF1131623.1 unnamed protein product [Didymodactylos carnosus]CAF3608578.1 unnamed protein product [Didymodactylos carnosus]CAF3895396.1 unnamed protein product [Didymodactylos carnosus]